MTNFVRIAITGLVILFAILFTAHAVAAPAKWILIATSGSGATFEAQVTSIDYDKNEADDIVITIHGRMTLKDGRIRLEVWSVKVTDCDAGRGKLVVLDTEGKLLLESPFLLEGGTVASTISTQLCDVHANMKERLKSQTPGPSKNTFKSI